MISAAPSAQSSIRTDQVTGSSSIMRRDMRRWFALVLLVYVTLDFSDPNLPGALNFDLDQSVDAVHTLLRGQLPVAKISTLPVSPLVDGTRGTAPLETVTVRPFIVARRSSSFVRPRALLANARPPGSTEPH